MGKRYLLFDVDGTLINAGGAGKRAMVAAFKAILGDADLTQGYSFAGKTDLQIMADVVRGAGIKPRKAAQTVKAIELAYIDNLKGTLKEASGFMVYPHIRELLEACKARPEFELALLTGNLARGAQLKLEHANLWHYFTWGVFGNFSEERIHLAEQAFSIISRMADNVSPADLVVIGDTTNDIRCGKSIGATTVVYFSGFEPLEKLQQANPDFLIHNFKDLYPILHLPCAP